MERKPWMDQEPPVNYVAGMGRGATGFTTRSDIGPAKMELPTVGESTAKETTSSSSKKDDGENDNDKEDGENYDDFEGYGGSFTDSNQPYEEDDLEADLIWDQIEKKNGFQKKKTKRRNGTEKNGRISSVKTQNSNFVC